MSHLLATTTLNTHTHTHAHTCTHVHTYSRKLNESQSRNNYVYQAQNIYYIVERKEEKTMAPHYSTLAWKIPWMEEPGRLQSMGSLRVGYD